MWDCDPEQAFEQLCRLARERRQKVRLLAEHVVRGRGAELRSLGPVPDGASVAVPPQSGVIELRESSSGRRTRPAG